MKPRKKLIRVDVPDHDMMKPKTFHVSFLRRPFVLSSTVLVHLRAGHRQGRLADVLRANVLHQVGVDTPCGLITACHGKVVVAARTCLLLEHSSARGNLPGGRACATL